MNAELLTPDAGRWREVLGRVRHDFYHLPEYVAFASRRQDVGEACAFVAEDADGVFFLPLIVRPVPGADDGGPRLFDATGPRGYPGPLVEPTGDGERAAGFLDRAVEALRSALRDRGIVAAFVRLHPLLTPPLASTAGEVRDHGTSVSIDLQAPEQEQWRLVDHGHRLGIHKAVRSGYTARMDEAWERFDEFVDVYAQSMARLGAAPFYRFPSDYFADLRAALGPHVHLGVVERGTELASAALFTETCGLVEFHLSGTADAHLQASPSKVLIDFARRWATARGDRALHLGGSVRAGDSLSQFKAGFSPLRHPVRSWRLVADAAAYDRLVERASQRGIAGGADADFFPAYRAPGGGTA